MPSQGCLEPASSGVGFLTASASHHREFQQGRGRSELGLKNPGWVLVPIQLLPGWVTQETLAIPALGLSFPSHTLSVPLPHT